MASSCASAPRSSAWNCPRGGKGCTSKTCCAGAARARRRNAPTEGREKADAGPPFLRLHIPLRGAALERLPALQLLHEQGFDLGAALLVGAQFLWRALVVLRIAHARRDGVLLRLERLDLAR